MAHLKCKQIRLFFLGSFNNSFAQQFLTIFRDFDNCVKFEDVLLKYNKQFRLSVDHVNIVHTCLSMLMVDSNLVYYSVDLSQSS